jgi:hypothetical protein
MKEIPLTRGMSATVDDEDFEHLSKFKWSAWSPYKDKRTFYAARGGGKVIMGREILDPEPGMECDYIDGNGLNCCRSNLRVCTPAQQAQNRGLQKIIDQDSRA